MDAVEVDCYPVEVAAPPPRLTGSEGFGRVRVSVEGAGDPPVGSFPSSLDERRDGMSTVDVLGLTSWDRVPDVTLCHDIGQLLPCFGSKDLSKQLPSSCRNDLTCTLKAEDVQLRRKAGKVVRSTGGCPKRTRLTQLEDATVLTGADNARDLSEKSQLAKHKKNFSSKRCNRRNFKVCLKTKYECFSMKAGMVGCCSAAGGNNFFGLYGLKTDVQDITKLVDDISLNDLFDGTYVCPSLGKDKGKKAVDVTEEYLHSVRRACNIFQLSKPVKSETLTEMDGCSNEKMATCPSSSVSMVAYCDSSATASCSSNQTFHSQESCTKPETPAHLLDFSFEQPLNTLECLALTPPKDLESLLLDATKSAVPSRSSPDPRTGKQLCRRVSLPPFPWSHTFSGHTKSNSDAAKSLTRSTCQGRWVKLVNFFSSPGIISDGFMDLDSLTYDESLVPVCGPKLPVVERNISHSKSVPWCDHGLPVLTATSIALQFSREPGAEMKYEGKVEHCPRLLAAAQTLCDIATHTLKIDHYGMIRWPEKLPKKATKARKSKSKEEVFTESTSLPANNTVKSGSERMVCSKRPRPSTIDSKKVLSHTNGIRRDPLRWSTPKSSRSSPNKSFKDLIAETRNLASYMVKRSCMMPPPPAKVPSRNCNGQRKVRKLMQMDWSREGGRQD